MVRARLPTPTLLRCHFLNFSRLFARLRANRMDTETAELTLEGLVHDLNNVFQTIAETAELLSSDPKWARLANTLQRSVESGQRIAHSIVEQQRSIADFAGVLESAIAYAGDSLELSRAPALRFERSIEPGFRVPGNAGCWQRILVNLFLNSAEAGAANISITAAADEITIVDDGPGIAQDVLPRIFEPHISTKAATSGLGLYVVRSTLDQCGCRVSAENGKSRGAVFHIKLPAGIAELVASADRSLEENKGRSYE